MADTTGKVAKTKTKTKAKAPKAPPARAKRFRDLVDAGTVSRRHGGVDLGSVHDKVVEARKSRHTGRNGDSGRDSGSGSGDVLSRLRQRQRERGQPAADASTHTDASVSGDASARQREVARFVADVVAELAAGGTRALSERHVAQVAADSSDGRVALAEAQAAVASVVQQLAADGRATRRRGVFRVLR